MEPYYPIADPDFLANLRSESLESFQPQLAIKTHGCDVEMPRSKPFLFLLLSIVSGMLARLFTGKVAGGKHRLEV